MFPINSVSEGPLASGRAARPLARPLYMVLTAPLLHDPVNHAANEILISIFTTLNGPCVVHHVWAAEPLGLWGSCHFRQGSPTAARGLFFLFTLFLKFLFVYLFLFYLFTLFFGGEGSFFFTGAVGDQSRAYAWGPALSVAGLVALLGLEGGAGRWQWGVPGKWGCLEGQGRWGVGRMMLHGPALDSGLPSGLRGWVRSWPAVTPHCSKE